MEKLFAAFFNRGAAILHGDLFVVPLKEGDRRVIVCFGTGLKRHGWHEWPGNGNFAYQRPDRFAIGDEMIAVITTPVQAVAVGGSEPKLSRTVRMAVDLSVASFLLGRVVADPKKFGAEILPLLAPKIHAAIKSKRLLPAGFFGFLRFIM